jgi:H+/gluconate symporter-like permease
MSMVNVIAVVILTMTCLGFLGAIYLAMTAPKMGGQAKVAIVLCLSVLFILLQPLFLFVGAVMLASIHTNISKRMKGKVE